MYTSFQSHVLDFSICFQNMVVISPYFSELLVLKEVNIFLFNVNQRFPSFCLCRKVTCFLTHC